MEGKVVLTQTKKNIILRKKLTGKGGAGRGQGRKLIYGEETERVSIKVPISKKEQFKKEAHEKILKKWIVKPKKK
jgi:hypothetical protein